MAPFTYEHMTFPQRVGKDVGWHEATGSQWSPAASEEGSNVKVVNRLWCTDAVSKLSSSLNLLDRVKCSFWQDVKGGRGVDSGPLCVSKVVSTLGATSHLSASPNTAPNDPTPLRQQPCPTLPHGAIWSSDTSVQKLHSDYQLIKSRFRMMNLWKSFRYVTPASNM